jgi:hypothetical protein
MARANAEWIKPISICLRRRSRRRAAKTHVQTMTHAKACRPFNLAVLLRSYLSLFALVLIRCLLPVRRTNSSALHRWHTISKKADIACIGPSPNLLLRSRRFWQNHGGISTDLRNLSSVREPWVRFLVRRVTGADFLMQAKDITRFRIRDSAIVAFAIARACLFVIARCNSQLLNNSDPLTEVANQLLHGWSNSHSKGQDLAAALTPFHVELVAREGLVCGKPTQIKCER